MNIRAGHAERTTAVRQRQPWRVSGPAFTGHEDYQMSRRPFRLALNGKNLTATLALALGMAAWRDEQGTVGDTTAVFRDSAFENDVAKSNLAAILEQHGIKQVRSL